MASISSTIESSYFLLLSTGIYKRAGLLWEQRVGGSNPSAPTMQNPSYFGRQRPFRPSICYTLDRPSLTRSGIASESGKIHATRGIFRPLWPELQ